MASPEILAMESDITRMRSEVSAFRGRIESEVNDFRRKLSEQADATDAKIKELEDAKNKLKEIEEAPVNV
jgi:hypothetical protein